jgi:hypothetical protein
VHRPAVVALVVVLQKHLVVRGHRVAQCRSGDQLVEGVVGEGA